MIEPGAPSYLNAATLRGRRGACACSPGVHMTREYEDFEAEINLLEEILLDAINCWQEGAGIGALDRSYLTSRERLYREAEFWIFGEYENSPFLSFDVVCINLGLDADFIRRRLQEWRRRSVERANSRHLLCRARKTLLA